MCVKAIIGVNRGHVKRENQCMGTYGFFLNRSLVVTSYTAGRKA